MSLSLYVLVGFRRSRLESNEAALKYFLLGAFASGFLLYGIALLYGATGTSNLARMGAFLSDTPLLDNPLLRDRRAARVHRLRVQGRGGALPHVDARRLRGRADVRHRLHVGGREGRRLRRAAARRPARAGAASQADWTPLLAVIAFLTMTVGNVTALLQNNLKRMLAYSSIAHAGYILVAVAAGGAEGAAAAVFYLAVYSFMNLGAFAVLTMMGRGRDERVLMSDLAGLGFRQPLLGLAMTMFMISLGGIPPTAGFMGKIYVFGAAMKRPALLWLVIAGVLNSVVSVYYYLRVTVAMYMREPEGEAVQVSWGVAGRASRSLLALAATLWFGVQSHGLWVHGAATACSACSRPPRRFPGTAPRPCGRGAVPLAGQARLRAGAGPAPRRPRPRAAPSAASGTTSSACARDCGARCPETCSPAGVAHSSPPRQASVQRTKSVRPAFEADVARDADGHPRAIERGEALQPPQRRAHERLEHARHRGGIAGQAVEEPPLRPPVRLRPAGPHRDAPRARPRPGARARASPGRSRPPRRRRSSAPRRTSRPPPRSARPHGAASSRQPLGDRHLGAGLFGQQREHAEVAVADRRPGAGARTGPAARRRSRAPRPAARGDLHLGDAERGEQRQVVRRQLAALGEDALGLRRRRRRRRARGRPARRGARAVIVSPPARGEPRSPSSNGTTASAPAGGIAPVMMRIASPGAERARGDRPRGDLARRPAA